MNKEERLKAAEAAYPIGLNGNININSLERFAFIKGAEAEAESIKLRIETIRKRVLFVSNTGSKSRAEEKLLFKELDTLNWVLQTLNQQ